MSFFLLSVLLSICLSLIVFALKKRKLNKTNNSLSVYNQVFEKAKNNLLKIYINERAIKNLISNFKTIKVHLVHDETSIRPGVIVVSKDSKAEITNFFNYGSKENYTLHVGYKNADDWLDNKGKLLSKSALFQRQLELIVCNNNYIVWLFYKIREFIFDKLNK